MAFSNSPRDSQVDSILQSLSRFAPQPTPQPTPPPQVSLPHHLGVPNPGDPRPRSTTSVTKAAPPRPSSTSVDPSTITEWRIAQKYVTFTLAQNEAVIARIRKMVKRQHEHEHQWWEGRKALISKQSGRVEGTKTVDSLLKSLGGNVGTSTEQVTAPTTEQNAEELRKYDGKIYKALTEMSRAIDGELRGMGVPFFAIKHDLVALAKQDQDSLKKSDGNKQKLSREELKELQKKMIDLLEDLFGG
ncbi:MAG: hypothetical protein Q9160_001333 [Pyrenula sp. 1 TL-2023]